VVVVGAILALVMPALSLPAKNYGRTVRGLSYLLIGVFSMIAVVTYAFFYKQYTPGIESILQKVPVGLALNYPFYLILASSSVFVVVGVLEWLRRPRFLFRTYVPPPPKPPKPRRMPVPEVVEPSPQPSTTPPSVPLPSRLPISSSPAESEKKRKAVSILPVIAGIAYIISSLLLYTPTFDAVRFFALVVIPPVLALTLFTLSYALYRKPARHKEAGIVIVALSVAGLIESLYLLSILLLLLLSHVSFLLPYTVLVGTTALLAGSILGLIGGARAIRRKREEGREPSTVSPAPEVAVPPQVTVGRPLGITFLVFCYIIAAFAGLVSLPFVYYSMQVYQWLAQLSPQSTGSTLMSYLWTLILLQILSAVVDVVLVYGLLKRKDWARVVVRILSLLAVIGVLAAIVYSMLVMFPIMSVAGAYVPFMGSIIGMVYGILAVTAVVAIIPPVVIFWYMGRANVRAYFATQTGKE
jgi:hypothetical protein